MLINWFDVDMHLERVGFEAALVGVAAVTNLTLVDARGLLLHLVVVVTHVMLQVGQLGEGSLAVLKLTPVGFLTRVDPVVLLEVGQLLEATVTALADVLPLTRMNDMVLL